MREKEVFTIHAVNDEPNNFREIEDPRTWCIYESMDEAIDDAKELYNELIKKHRHLEVSVCFNEFQHPSGDILGEPECLSLRDLGVLIESPIWTWDDE